MDGQTFRQKLKYLDGRGGEGTYTPLQNELSVERQKEVNILPCFHEIWVLESSLLWG